MAIGVGIDISKDKVDVALSDGSTWGEFANSIEGMEALVRRLQGLEVHRVVLEASGGFERLVLAQLHAAGLTMVLVQPARSRHFAKALGRYAKTDAIDARVLASMAVHVVDEVEPWQPLDEDVAALRALCERRTQLVILLDAERKRLRSSSPVAHPSIQAAIAFFEKSVKDIEAQVKAAIAASAEISAKVEKLDEVVGIGLTTAVALVAWMPELGRVNRREVAALAGVAPINRDSGTKSGQRFTFGGRVQLRNSLYMATLAASTKNPHIAAYYKKLLARGKPKKVALVACMRKMLIHLNAIMRDLLAPTHAEPATAA